MTFDQSILTAANPEADFPLGVSGYLLHLVSAAARLRENKFDSALQPLGLNVSLYRVLDVIARFEPCAMTEAAAFSYVNRTTATRIVDQLVRVELVERIYCPADRRQVLLGLTGLGRACHVEAADLVAEPDRQAVADLPDEAAMATILAARILIGRLASDGEEVERLLSFRRRNLPSRCEFLAQQANRDAARCNLQCREASKRSVSRI